MGQKKKKNFQHHQWKGKESSINQICLSVLYWRAQHLCFWHTMSTGVKLCCLGTIPPLVFHHQSNCATSWHQGHECQLQGNQAVVPLPSNYLKWKAHPFAHCLRWCGTLHTWWDTKLLVKDLKGQGPLIKGLPWTPPSPHNLCSDQFITLKSNQLPTQSFSLLCHWKPKEKPPLLLHVL